MIAGRADRTNGVVKSAAGGLAASLALLAIYFGLLTLVSGWTSTVGQFSTFWPYVVALAGGFGIQIALYLHLRRVVRPSAQGRMVAASGVTSTAAMVSCCIHYLANVLPILGAAGLVTIATQYQLELFWVGLALNAAGVAYVGANVVAAAREHARCVAADSTDLLEVTWHGKRVLIRSRDAVPRSPRTGRHLRYGDCRVLPARR